MKKESWIIVANSSHARVFKLEKLDLIEMDSLIHPECRMHEGDLVGDRPGQTNESSGVRSSHYMQPHQSQKKVEAVIFAKQLAEHLDLARSNGELERLFLAAAPSFLGLLRQEMSSQTASLVTAEVDKDITHLKPAEIRSYFPIGI